MDVIIFLWVFVINDDKNLEILQENFNCSLIVVLIYDCKLFSMRLICNIDDEMGYYYL